jgi:hypothetical protein
MANNAVEHKLALSFNLLMYEDGSVSPASLEMMHVMIQRRSNRGYGACQYMDRESINIRIQRLSSC